MTSSNSAIDTMFQAIAERSKTGLWEKWDKILLIVSKAGKIKI